MPTIPAGVGGGGGRVRDGRRRRPERLGSGAGRAWWKKNPRACPGAETLKSRRCRRASRRGADGAEDADEIRTDFLSALGHLGLICERGGGGWDRQRPARGRSEARSPGRAQIAEPTMPLSSEATGSMLAEAPATASATAANARRAARGARNAREARTCWHDARLCVAKRAAEAGVAALRPCSSGCARPRRRAVHWYRTGRPRTWAPNQVTIRPTRPSTGRRH